MCTCGLEPETTLHYLLRCSLFCTQRLELLNNIFILNPSIKNYSNEKLLNVLLYGSEDFKWNLNKEILKATIKLLKRSERFNDPRFLTILKKFVLMILIFHIYFSFLFLDICTKLTLSDT